MNREVIPLVTCTTTLMADHNNRYYGYSTLGKTCTCSQAKLFHPSPEIGLTVTDEQAGQQWSTTSEG